LFVLASSFLLLFVFALPWVLPCFVFFLHRCPFVLVVCRIRVRLTVRVRTMVRVRVRARVRAGPRVTVRVRVRIGYLA
jgi:hypothetical protein